MALSVRRNALLMHWDAARDRDKRTVGWIERDPASPNSWVFRSSAGARASAEEIVPIEQLVADFNRGSLVQCVEPYGVCTRCGHALSRRAKDLGDGRVECTECQRAIWVRS